MRNSGFESSAGHFVQLPVTVAHNWLPSESKGWFGSKINVLFLTTYRFVPEHVHISPGRKINEVSDHVL